MAEVNVTVDPAIQPRMTHYNGEPVEKADRTAVLIQNSGGQYKFCPKYIADKMVADHEAVVLEPSDHDYLEGFKSAWGHVEGCKAGETIQFKGKMMRPEEIGRVDFKSALDTAIAEVEKATGGKKGIVVAAEMPPAVESFEQKVRARAKRRFAGEK